MDTSQSAVGNGVAGKSQIPSAGRDASSSYSTQNSSNSKHNSQQSSAGSSLTSSRETSPTRSLRATIAAARKPSSGSLTGPGNRSRKNSQADLSPSRLAKPNSTGAAAQGTALPSKTITAATTPTLLPGPHPTDPSIKTPIPQKSPAHLEQLRDAAPRWPVSPRLRSPPPILNKPNLGPAKKSAEGEQPPALSLQRPTPPSWSDGQSDAETDDPQSGMRTPARGGSTNTLNTLETVQEVSPLSTPRGLDTALRNLEESLTSDASSSQGEQGDLASAAAKARTAALGAAPTNESGSDSGSMKAERRPTASVPPPSISSRHSSISTITGKPAGGKGKPAEKTMTVETETVTSIPSVGVAPASMQGTNGSLRTKPSNETIRPKKDKKKQARKQQSVQPNAASSKADNFEAKIVSAVDEADTSDSEETFVYDSNPPDVRDRPHTRFHSRTPSATSMVSQVDRNGMRSIHSVLESGLGPTSVMPTSSVALKKKKFSNTFNTSAGPDGGMGPDDEGTVRANPAGSARSTASRHPAHIGIWGRNGGGNGHTYLFDNESPFLGNQRSRPSGGSLGPSMRQSPGPPSPRFANAVSRGLSGTVKRGSQGGYDLDDTTTTGADDERTPLIHNSIRSSRSRRAGSGGNGPLSRYHHSLAASSRHQGGYRRQPPSLLNRMASCLVLTVMLLLVVSGAIGFMFATSQPLTSVELVKMTNVIASEQELMFDMTVKAQNPNIVVINVDSSDLEIFAKSPHAGPDDGWWRVPRPPSSRRSGLPAGEKPGTFAARRTTRKEEVGQKRGDDWYPEPPVDDTSPNFRIGTIRELDQPLQFEGSFFSKGASVSKGSLRLENPGNGTVEGVERWRNIIEDEFDLVVKGVLKYTLPMSQRIRTISLSGRSRVKPNSATEPDDGEGEGDAPKKEEPAFEDAPKA